MMTLLLVACHGESSCGCQMDDAKTVKIVDLGSASAIIKKARDDFLSQRAVSAFNMLQATILIKSNSSTASGQTIWYRGSVDGSVIQYPASCVKMNYLLGAMQWCKDKGRPASCLDDHVRPMIVYSDNYQTGFVVDAITESVNIQDLNSTSDPRWEPWFKKRRYTENLLKSMNMLENEIVLSKTYPTNSGDDKYGAEKVLIDTYGSNRMQPCCAASLMLYLQNERSAEEIEYAKSVLWHRRNDGWSSFGYSLPPSTTLYNKIGNAYDTIEDIARIILPNGVEFILAAFSNGYQRPTDLGVLGMFAEKVMEYFGFLQAAPGPAFITLNIDQKTNYSVSGDWKVDIGTVDRIGSSVLLGQPSSSANVSWSAKLTAGFYEVLVYIPTIEGQSTDLIATVQHQYGTDTVKIHAVPSRWNKLGDFLFTDGLHNSIVTIQTTSSGLTVVNAVRFAQYMW